MSNVTASKQYNFNYRSFGHKIFELISVIGFFLFEGLLLWEIIKTFPYHYSTLTFVALFFAALLGYLAADFTSGMVHFICDNFGSEKTPIIGAKFITPFRVHHIDPEDISRHDFLETNGHNSFISLPALIPVYFFIPLENWFGFLISFFVFSFLLGIFGTNQFHKWAHTKNPQKIVQKLQKWRLILSKENHQIHHNSPFDKYYCITTGWLNPILTKIGFFEFIIKVFRKKS